MSAQQSAIGALKRKAALFGVSLLMATILMAIAFPEMPVLSSFGALLGVLWDNPSVLGVVVVFGVGIVAAAWIQDNVGR